MRGSCSLPCDKQDFDIEFESSCICFHIVRPPHHLYLVQRVSSYSLPLGRQERTTLAHGLLQLAQLAQCHLLHNG